MTCTTTTTTEMDFFHSNFMLHNPHHDEEAEDHLNNQPSTSLPPHHLLPTNCNPHQEFHAGVATVLLGNRPSMPLMVEEEMNNHGGVDEQDDLSDDGSQVGEKKRRLNVEQVRTLEKNFELGNKLEPDRKMQLARALGLQPRQIAIWFQNKRARWKTKQLEKDYELLKRQFEAVQAENNALHSHNQKLHAQIMALKTREPTESINLNKETEGSSSNRSENGSDIKLDINSSSNPAIDSPNLSKGGAHFPSTLMRPAQLFQSTTPSSRPDPKIDHRNNNSHVKEEGSLCNMFVGMDEHAGFWPWLEQQHFN